MPFNRDKLYLSIYSSCKHRPNAITDASALTETALSKLIKSQKSSQGLVLRDNLVKIVSETLKQFDDVAYVHYGAFHGL